MKRTLFLAATSSLLLSACAMTPTEPLEPEISVQLKGTAVEVQHFIEERYRKNIPAFRVVEVDERKISLRAHCSQVQELEAVSCGLILLAIGNSRWDGPYFHTTYRTSEIRGVTHLAVSTEWCATNAFGKENCRTNGSNSDRNALLRTIEKEYTQQSASSQYNVRPLSERR